MSKLPTLLDQARAHSNLPSDYALAKRIGVTTQIVSNWRHDRKYPGLLHIFTLADLAGRSQNEVIAELELEKASRAGRVLQEQEWGNKLTKLTGFAGAAVMAFGFFASPDASADVNMSRPAITPLQVCILCQLGLRLAVARLARVGVALRVLLTRSLLTPMGVGISRDTA